MKIYAPLYYKNFRCIAGDCRHSCCIGWRISLDGATVERYEKTMLPYGEELRRHIAKDGEGAYIPTGDSGKCPHLDECGLCRVIRNCGEEYLSDICREHPRFYNECAGRIEAGLGASCPEAARLIIEGGSSLLLSEIGEDGERSGSEGYYTPIALRSEIDAIIRSCRLYADAEARIAELIALPPTVTSEEFRREVLSDIEYLDAHDREVLLSDGGKAPDTALLNILSYFILRHLAEAESDAHAAAIVGFALLSVRAVEAASAAVGIADALRIYSEEVEYSPDNTEDIIFAIESEML